MLSVFLALAPAFLVFALLVFRRTPGDIAGRRILGNGQSLIEIIPLEPVHQRRAGGKGCFIDRAFQQGLFRPVGLELAMATLQTAAFGLAHLYIAQQMEFVAPTIHDDPELAGQVYCLSFAGLMTPAGHRLLEEQGTNPFLAVPPIPDVLDPGD